MRQEVFDSGKNVYGQPLGILMLQSRFPRIPGDAGNAYSWPFPVRYRVVEGASPDTVVRRLAVSDLLEPFVTAALELESEGVSVLTTNCGFLVLYQERIQRRLQVPFISSSLLQVPFLQNLLPAGQEVGILTVERRSLSPAHISAAGLPSDIPIVGMEEVGGIFISTVIGDASELNATAIRAEHVAAAKLLCRRHPNVGAIVLECTNMPPYADAIQEAVGLPVHDITTLAGWVVGAHQRVPYKGFM